MCVIKPNTQVLSKNLSQKLSLPNEHRIRVVIALRYPLKDMECTKELFTLCPNMENCKDNQRYISQEVSMYQLKQLSHVAGIKLIEEEITYKLF